MSLRFFNKTQIDHIIALCHIINEYEEFSDKIKTTIPNINHKFFQDLRKLITGKGGFVSSKIKSFYNNNKDVIDTINNYTDVIDFIGINYKGGRIASEEFYLIRDYILKNKSQIDKILAVLEKLKELGFTELYFDETLDFTSENYYMPLAETIPLDIDFVNNISIIPSYKSNGVSYKTNRSPYLITLRINFNLNIWDKDILHQEILLNSLTFDPKELPNSITKENTFGKIIELSKQNEPVSTTITDSVDLSVGIKDLVDAYQQLDAIVTKVKNGDATVFSSGQDIKKIYLQIGNGITELQKISADFDANAILKYPDLSQEKINNEVKRYLKRREDAKIHWD